MIFAIPEEPTKEERDNFAEFHRRRQRIEVLIETGVIPWQWSDEQIEEFLQNN